MTHTFAGMMPKRGIDPNKNELARFYKVHASKNLVEPVSMIVPRKVGYDWKCVMVLEIQKWDVTFLSLIYSIVQPY